MLYNNSMYCGFVFDFSGKFTDETTATLLFFFFFFEKKTTAT